ncbi:MAG: hypothetical protein M0Z52_02750 [Actinomycetota bacterium]|nr:hypothetical protein [Actinomycetota bacterium]
MAHLPDIDRAALLFLIALTLNLPLGYLRSKVAKRSFKWFLYIHLSIPFIILARLFVLDLHFVYVLVSVPAAVIGQIAGGRLPLLLAKSQSAAD